LQRKDRTAQIALVSAGDGSVRTLKSVAWDGVSNMALSPDGRELAFDLRGADAGSRDVFVLAVDGSRETPAAAFQGDDSLVGWSPEGQLLFVSNRTGFTGLWTMPMKGGTPQAAPVLLKRDVGRFWPAGVTTSGAIYSAVLSPPGAQLHLARLDVNRPQLAAEARVLDEFVGVVTFLHWSRDGESLAYSSQWMGMQPRTPSGLLDPLKLRFVVASARTGERRELRPTLSYINDFAWTADGQGFYAAGADVQGGKGVYHIDAQTGTTRQLARVLAHEETQLAGIWTEQRDKLYYLRIVTANQTTKLVEHDLRTGTDRDLYAYEPRPDRDVAAIAGGRIFRLVTTRATTLAAAPGPDQSTMLVSSSLAGDGTKELLRAGYPDVLTLLDWSPDRTYGFFAKTVRAQGQTELWRVPVNGSEPAKVATVPDLSSLRCGGWADGGALYCTRNLRGERNELWRLTTAGELIKVQAIQPATAYGLRPSPTQSHIAYQVPDNAAERPLEVWVLENARPSARR
jgi:dipeptidyl aminopeptidase/acylaminoacyl peptidase